MLRREFLRSSLAAAVGTALAHDATHSGETRRILYVLGQFSAGTPEQMHAAAETLGGSGFNILILSFLQASVVGGKLTLLYNGNAFPLLRPEVPGLLARLRSGFAQKKRIMISIGGWNQLETFEAIRTFGVPAFVARLTEEAIVPLGLEGVDLDLEPQTGGLDRWLAVHHEYGEMLAALTNEYKRVHPTHLVTHAPVSGVAAEIYAKPEALPGLRDGLLAATRTRSGNNIDWLNVQFYEGGAVKGGDIADYYRESLAMPLIRTQDESGVRRPLHFLTPLFEPDVKQPLGYCRQTIAAIDRRCANLHAGTLDGVALWEYRQVAPSIQQWSSGLQSALRG